MSKEPNVKTITIDEFEELVNEGMWVISDRGYTIKSSHYSDDEGVAIIWGFAWETMTLDGISMTYTDNFFYKKGDPDSLMADSAYPSRNYEGTWSIEGVRVVEEVGGKLEECEVEELSGFFPRSWNTLDYKKLDIDFDSEEYGATRDQGHVQYYYNPGNWVIEKIDSGRAVMETHNPEVFEAFEKDLFRLWTVEDWLVEVSKREDAGCASAA